VNRLILLLLLFIVIGIFGCGGLSVSSSPQLKLPSTSPVKVVSDYLGSLKKTDFVRAYEFISIGYAGSLDKESYKTNMEQSLIKKYDWSLLNYQIKGVRIIGDQAYVVTELEVQFKPLNSEKKIQKTIGIQYILAVLDSKWKIISDECISNCISPEIFTGKESGSVDSN
jgi:hypothetical protein